MKKGFTLIEIVMVVMILTILVALAVPNFLRFKIRSEAIEQLQNEGVKEITEEMIQVKIETNKYKKKIYKPKIEKYIETEFEKDFRRMNND